MGTNKHTKLSKIKKKRTKNKNLKQQTHKETNAKKLSLSTKN